MSTDSDPARISADLEALKLWLIAMRPEQLPETQAGEIAAQISAIRLQLKRLQAEREGLTAAHGA